MADRKEPPFYNDDNMGTFHYKLPFYETMELFIETLTGTCFQLRVSPFEAVISVKAKIQRLEGIPVAQQHLIWNNLELDDEYCLHDYSIAEGCTLKLVLAMRGGPINTRRVTVEDPIKDVSELMEGTGGSREEGGWEKPLPNKQVTFLVYRDGDQLNFFRVVDRGDGTLTPLSESLSGGSLYNVYTEDDDVGDTSAAAQHSLENNITMNKMKLLKAKMEDMNLNKKPKKSAKLKPRPPVSPHPCGGSLGPPPGARHHHHHHHHHRLFHALPLVSQSRHSSSGTQLPPIRDHQHHREPAEPPVVASASSSSAHLSVSRRAPPPSFSASSSCYMLQEEEEACPPVARPPPKVSRLDVGGARLMRDCVYPQLPPLATRGQPEGALDVAESRGEALGLLEDLVEPVAAAQPPGPPLLEELLSADPMNLEVCTSMQAEEVTEQQQLLAPPAPSLLSTCSLGLSPPSPLPSCASPCLASRGLHHHHHHHHHQQHFDFTSSTVRSHVQAQHPPTLLAPGNVSPRPPAPSSTSSSPPRPARLRCVKVDSPGKRSEVICKSEARSITKMANQACQEAEPLGTLSHAHFLATLSSARPATPRAAGGAGSSSREEGLRLGLALPTASASGPGLLGPSMHLHQEDSASGPGLLGPSMHLLQEDLILHRGANAYMASNSLGSAGGPSTSIRRLGTPTYHLPPVKAPVGGKKKSSKHCFLCGKKTGLATSYECRCGHNFCATHRYAETHDCTYDYKSAGRRFLQDTNPIISTPKLPKI